MSAPNVTELDLPKPPVPDLASTLRKYSEGIKAIVPSGTYKKTKGLIDEFGKKGGEGEKLQRHLQEYARSSDNYVRGFWLDDMYLKNPAALPVNSNPFFLLPRVNFTSDDDRYGYVAKFIIFSLLHKQKIDRKELPQEYAGGHGKGNPLSMDTYYKFFSAYRKPGLKKDEQIFVESSKHFIVICNNQIFLMELASNESIPSENVIKGKLKEIEDSSRDSRYPAVGILTADTRPNWAKNFELMSKNKINGQSLQKIQKCLFVICLDDAIPLAIDKEELDVDSMTCHLLHGNGVKISSGNRWYDKFLQFVVTKDGVSGFVIEHSVSEGITVLNFAEQLLKFLKDKEEVTSARDPNLTVTKLEWEIAGPISTEIGKTSQKMDELAQDVDLRILKFTEYGKGFVKGIKTSPDVYIQLSLQLAYFKTHQKICSTYESAGLRKFRLGRIDNIRALSEEAFNWVKAMCGNAKDEEKLQLFQKAVKKQTDILVYTINGEGPDNHLLCLKEMANVKKLKEPSLFKDESYREFLNFRLSTSQLPTKEQIIVGYGAVVPDGYGCSYNPCEEEILFCITSFRSAKQTSSEKFAQNLKEGLIEMKNICSKK